MKKSSFFITLIMVLLLTGCIQKETSTETVAEASLKKIDESQEVSPLCNMEARDEKQTEQILGNSWIGYYTRRAESVDNGSIIMEFFIYQENDKYFGYLNMDGFENDGEWAYSYPQGRILVELREEQGKVGAYFVEDFSEIRQEEYFGSYQKDDLLFSMSLENSNLCINWEKLAIREKEESKKQDFIHKESCLALTLVNQRDKEIYLKARGILTEEAPFYQYEEDGQMMELYYDEKEKTGVGLSYGESIIAAFDVAECEQKVWQDSRLWLTKDGTETSVLKETESDFVENREYNTNGQLTKYEAKGMITEENEVDTLVRIEFFYREDGTLERKECYYNPKKFGTFRCTENFYYDSLERLLYTSAYVTHGVYEDYYIYEEGCMEPTYCLTVDYMGQDACMLDFVKYVH